MSTIRTCVALALIVAIPTPAHAYLDPGTGSILLQGILAAIAGGLFTIKLWWARISGAVARLFGRGEEHKKGSTE